MKYTKGKWELNPKNKQMVIIKDKKGFLQTPQHPEFIIVQTSLYTSPEHDECLANAQLISAAPDMYEAIKEYMEWGAKTGSDRDLLESNFIKALAKAKGKT